MFEWEIHGRRFYIRETRTEPEFHAIEDIQREAWQFSDLDIVPFASLIASQWAGAVVLGAFEGDTMIGFVYGFPAFEHRRASIHSHMLAVRNEWRNMQAGFYLKLAQRQWVLERGLNEITWTFDPLQSLNAHLNFAKLGVISRRYIVNFYGETSSSPLHQGFGTDRLWVTWVLDSDRVKERIKLLGRGSKPKLAPPQSLLSHDAPILAFSRQGTPELADLTTLLSAEQCFIEIPHDVNAVKQRDPVCARAWREATRAAFVAAIDAGFTADDLFRLEGKDDPQWFYSLTRASESTDASLRQHRE
jgi:predicted GNAT superfamily acetyltransferase